MSDFYTNVALVETRFSSCREFDERTSRLIINQRCSSSQTRKLSIGHLMDCWTLFAGGCADCREFIEQYKGVDGFKIYGNTDYIYQFIGDYFDGEVDYDPSKVVNANLDIETTCEHGFPDVDNPIERLSQSPLKSMETPRSLLWWVSWTMKTRCVISVRLRRNLFSHSWHIGRISTDIITGWNTSSSTCPILLRIAALFTEKEAKYPLFRKTTLSSQHQTREKTAVDIVGIANIDYLDLYRTFTIRTKSHTNLTTSRSLVGWAKGIAWWVRFYSTSQERLPKFMDYNYHDVHLVANQRFKMKLLELALALAYSAKVNYADVFSQVRTWDQIIYHHCDHKILSSRWRRVVQRHSVCWCVCQEPILGYKDWIVSFDLNSLYPHLIMQYNISPETKVDIPVVPTIHTASAPENILRDPVNDKYAGVAKCYSRSSNERTRILLPQTVCVSVETSRVLAALMEKMYQERKHYKKLMLQKKQTQMKSGLWVLMYANTSRRRTTRLRSTTTSVGSQDSTQLPYGAIGNQWFRYYDVDMAEAWSRFRVSYRFAGFKINLQWFLEHDTEDEGKDYILASDTDSVYIHLGDLVSSVYAESPCQMRSLTSIDRVTRSLNRSSASTNDSQSWWMLIPIRW